MPIRSILPSTPRSDVATDRTTTRGNFEVRDAVELAHAYVHAVAAWHAVRILTVKGPVNERFGLRESRVSSDADVLVDPAGFGTLVEVLDGYGWRPRQPARLDQLLPHHAVSLIHPNWPCDLDVHRSFPGFLAPPAVAFEALWVERVTLSCAGRSIAAPSRAGAILITALHAMRSPAYDPRSPREIDELVSRASDGLTPADVRQLVSLATDTGSAAALDGALSGLGVPRPARENSPALVAWRTRLASHWNGSSLWLTTLNADTSLTRPARLRAALWPDDTYLTASHPALSRDPRSLRAARIRRLLRGLRDVPLAMLRQTWMRSRRR